MDKPSLNTILNCPNLPTLPAVAVRVLELTRDQQVQIGEIARAVQNDQALCVRILRTVNSSYYALSKPCPTITRAITYLGLNTVKSLVLGFSLVDVSRGHGGGFDLLDHWRRAVYSATAARRLATSASLCDPDEAFIAALMQDLGMLAMHVAIGAPYAEIARAAAGRHGTLPGIEQKVLGFDHALVGAKLGERWKLPPSLVETILHHHDVQAVQHHHLVRTVVLGGRLAEVMSSRGPGAGLDEMRACARDWLSLDELDPSLLLEAVNQDARELHDLFQLDADASPNINELLAKAEDESLAHQVRVIQEAEELRERNAELGRQATTDPLTSLANRRRFDHVLREAFDAAGGTGGALGVILMDVDHFKRFNDTYGHETGDAVLVEVGTRMNRLIESSCLVARYGGEEFAVILPGCARSATAALAERLRVAIAEEPIRLTGPVLKDEPIRLTASLGVACYEPGLSSVFARPAVLVAAADKALYAAKNAGRNCVRVFTPRIPDSGGKSSDEPRTTQRMTA